MAINEIKCNKLYLCKKSVIMNYDPDFIAYYKGGIYISEKDRHITNNQGNVFHMWNVSSANKYFEEIDKPTFNTNYTEKYNKILDKWRKLGLLINVFKEDDTFKWFINDIAKHNIHLSPKYDKSTKNEAWHSAMRKAKQLRENTRTARENWELIG